MLPPFPESGKPDVSPPFESVGHIAGHEVVEDHGRQRVGVAERTLAGPNQDST
jgi:hypothetical protein